MVLLQMLNCRHDTEPVRSIAAFKKYEIRFLILREIDSVVFTGLALTMRCHVGSSIRTRFSLNLT